jgi:hypothetical protein
MGWRQEKFYLVDEKGNQTLLKIDEQIFRHESLNVNEPSLDAGMPVCKVKAGEFFYGPKEKLTYNNPIMEDEAFLSKYHPECRNRGVVYKKRAN